MSLNGSPLFERKNLYSMNQAIISLPTPLKTLMVTEVTCRELCNFLIYRSYPEILNERTRRQPFQPLGKLPTTVKEVGEILGAEKCEKGRKLYFDCARSENHAAVLLHNHGAQFWIHYFSSDIGLVSLSFFSHLASAEGSLLDHTCNVTHSHEYQWFTHDLSAEIFSSEDSAAKIERLGDYLIERVNPTLVSPYSIHFENPQIKEHYKFVSGNLERLKEVLTWARFVCKGLKREKDPNGKTWVSQQATINCGNLKDAPAFEHSTESLINAVGVLAVKENVPYTVLREGFGRRAGGECYDWARKNKHRMFLNLEQESRDVPIRLKIAAYAHLVNWLAEQGAEGERIIRMWNLKN